MFVILRPAENKFDMYSKVMNSAVATNASTLNKNQCQNFIFVSYEICLPKTKNRHFYALIKKTFSRLFSAHTKSIR